MIERIRVRAAPRVDEYDVVIEPGALDRIGELVPAAPMYAVISDANVAPIYGERVVSALSANARAISLSFPPGEQNKNAASWTQLTDDLIREGFARDGCIVALGGGVTGDLAGFVAATYMRGVQVVQMPTSLLAMIDASIGGKTGIDTAAGKNLVGAFHQPRIVVVDPLLLRSLPHEELRYGLAEAVKHGAIADAEYGAWIAASAASIFDHRMHTLTALVKRSIEIKAEVVSADVHEQGKRAALNFGHTIGHALEHVTRYAMPHGQAVAVGMMVECSAGEDAGITRRGASATLSRVLATLGLPVALPSGCDPSAVVEAARTDKKSRAGELRYTLLAQFGQVARDEKANWTMALPDDVVMETLTRLSTR